MVEWIGSKLNYSAKSVLLARPVWCICGQQNGVLAGWCHFDAIDFLELSEC